MEAANKRKMQIIGILMLFAASFIWGSTFVAQSKGMENVDAFTFTGVRCLLGSTILLPIIALNSTRKRHKNDKIGAVRSVKTSIICGAVLGILYCFATNLQQFAFYYSPSGKIAFITALYMFFVPLIGIFFRKRVPLVTWICVGIGFFGLFLLCVNPDDLALVNKGDLLSLGCALFFGLHIIAIERYVDRADGVIMSCVQFAVAGVFSCALMFIFEDPKPEHIKAAIFPIIYSGVMSCGIANTFQILGQKYTEATIASLIMCMESVFGVLCGAIILGETMTITEGLGCAIMFFAIILSQFSDKITHRIKSKK